MTKISYDRWAYALAAERKATLAYRNYLAAKRVMDDYEVQWIVRSTGEIWPEMVKLGRYEETLVGPQLPLWLPSTEA